MWHVLALALGGRTVAEWKAAMSDDEFDGWCEYYRRWPFDDFHRYHRPAALTAQMASGIKDVDGLLNWLQPDDAPRRGPKTEVDAVLWRAAGWKG